MYELYIGNKNYSSWSLRPWLVVSHFEIPFVEKQVNVAGMGAHDGHRGYSANGLVPCLHNDGFQIWDSLAIIEFLHETYPDLNIWPKDANARARARSISAEMHSGFGNLRGAMPMNIKMRLKGKTPSEEVAQDIKCIDEIWSKARTEFGQDSSQPYLFGAFSAADAMFAPVVWRLFSYNVQLSPVAQAYADAMRAHPSMRAWEAAALAETIALPYDAAVFEQYGGAR